MKTFFRALFRRKFIFWTLIAILIVVGYKAFGDDSKTADEFITVSRGSVVETVAVTGKVKPKNAASLRFESSGTISKLLVEAGDRVKIGQLLASLNAGDLRQKVVQAEAELSASLVKLGNAGQSLADTDVKSGQALSTAYADALAGLGTILNQLQTTYNAVNDIYSSVSLDNKLSTLRKLDDAYDTVVYALDDLTPASTRAEVDAALAEVYPELLIVQSLTLEMVRDLNTLSSNSENNAYRESGADALADINDSVAQVAAYRKNISDALVDGKLDNNSSSASYQSAQAEVATARASLAIARADLENASLYAPFDGVIASKSKSIGDGVSATDQIYYLIGEGGLEVSANIPEVDIAKVAVGNTATVILDAYGADEPFEVVITEIDPAETLVDGVATYKTTFSFTVNDERIRSGMTANIIVSTQRRDNILVLPFRAITVKDGKRVVRIVRGEERVDVPIQVGLRGNNGDVEIVSGLAEGDVVVIERK